ncbi:MAG: hypothetical protein LBC55_00935 [Desulfovibrio sp.]|nr:hypothetical protein [Desulfovibrio sp.]
MSSPRQGMPGFAGRQAAIPLNGNAGETQSDGGFAPKPCCGTAAEFL